jgi:2-iminobutanoate/2-iminopropanoate deaminase
MAPLEERKKRMTIDVVRTDRAPRSGSPISQAIRYGDLLFCSGQVGTDPDTDKLVEGGIRDQTRRVMENLGAILEAAGSGLDRVLKTTCFLTDIADFSDFNDIYASYFPGRKPARSTVAVTALAGPYVVEIEAIACIGEVG